MKKFTELLIIVLLIFTLFAISTGVSAGEAVSYTAPVYNTGGDAGSGIKEWQSLSCTEYTEVTDSSSSVTWSAGWYVVKGTVTISKTVTCSGDVHLILTDGCSLTVISNNNYLAGICVSGSGNSLTIYGQSAGTGSLVAKCADSAGGNGSAGIGGNAYNNGSDITINGGNVTASCESSVSGTYGAGIGGGTCGHGTDIVINGGKVTATCFSSYGNATGAGIGGGSGGKATGIVINGGEILACCSSTGGTAGGAAIGSGSKGYSSNSSSDIRISTKLKISGGTDENNITSKISNSGGDLTNSLSAYCCVSVTGQGTATAGTENTSASSGSTLYIIVIFGIILVLGSVVAVIASRKREC